MLIFFLAGQSNMAGRGSPAEDDFMTEMNDTEGSILNLEGRDEESEWKSAKEPLHLWVDCTEMRLACGSTSKSPPGQ